MLRGQKRTLYEGGIRVPLIAWQPGTVPQEETTEYTSALWDLMPTIAGLYGIEPPEGMDGVSLAPLLTGRSMEVPAEERVLYWEYPGQSGVQAVIWNGWKGVRRHAREFPDRRINLYRLSQDPRERRDVSKEYPDVSGRKPGRYPPRKRGPDGDSRIRRRTSAATDVCTTTPLRLHLPDTYGPVLAFGSARTRQYGGIYGY